MNIPQSDFYLREGNELVVKTTRDLLDGKRTVILMVPGAFTPTCTNQLPAFEAAYDDFTAKGVEQVLCVSVNDGFVMNAWGESLGIKNVKMIVFEICTSNILLTFFQCSFIQVTFSRNNKHLCT